MITLKKYPFTSILGWSASRFDSFEWCKRKYYYQYYAKHDTEFGKDRILSLKNMTGIALESGSVVHEVIEYILRTLQLGDELERTQLNDFLNASLETATKLTYSEVYYKQKEQITVDDLAPRVKTCLNNFMASDRFKWILNEASKWSENWLIEPPGYGEVRLDGVKAYCKVDCLMVINNEIIILDWKTGKKDEKKHAKQLLGYAAWAKEHLGLNCKIVPIDVYLQPEYSEMTIEARPEMIQDLANQIKSDTQEMYNYLVDVKNNVPKSKEEFPMCVKTYLCPWCNYRELCGRTI